MKKQAISLILALVVVLAITFFTANYALPFFYDMFGGKTYSETNCLTDMITNEMDIYDIAKSYRDGQATVSVNVTGKLKNSTKSLTSHGSGVCVASNGYETSLESGYVANKGSYIATNYHVIDIMLSNEFTDCAIKITPENGEEYSCELLWSNKDLDVAVLYCDSANLNYIKMKDRIIDCNKDDRIDYEEIFTIGAPLSDEYAQRFTKGDIASKNSMVFYTGEVIYPKYSPGTISGYTIYKEGTNGYEVLSNTYEDVVDISVGITSGNSGGGCFDENGYLIGLTTLGFSAEITDGNQMNGMVAIYPVIEVIDKLIENKEIGANNGIYTLENCNIFGMDAYEARIVSSVYTETTLGYYFIDGKFYNSEYIGDFTFSNQGYYILSNSNSKLNSITRGCVITSAQIEGEEKTKIIDRNDLNYLLLQIDDGDKVTFYYDNSTNTEKTITATF